MGTAPGALLALEHAFVDVAQSAPGAVGAPAEGGALPCVSLKLFGLEFGAPAPDGAPESRGGMSAFERLGEQLAADIALILAAITRGAAQPGAAEATPAPVPPGGTAAAPTPMLSALLESCVHAPRRAADHPLRGRGAAQGGDATPPLPPVQPSVAT